MEIAGYDVQARPIWVAEAQPDTDEISWGGVYGGPDRVRMIYTIGDEFAHYAPAGHPDGRVAFWVVPDGVHSITFRMWGAAGGRMNVIDPAFPNDPRDYKPPVLYARRWPVNPGDEVVMAGGGSESYYGIGIPTYGNGPIRGGWGGQNMDYGEPYRYVGGAGGGASAIWINGELVALAPGMGGWCWDTLGGLAGYHPPPSSSYPVGSAGTISRGAPEDPDFVGGRGGGGGGAPGGDHGTSGGGGGYNGATVPPAAIVGEADPSPLWGVETFGKNSPEDPDPPDDPLFGTQWTPYPNPPYQSTMGFVQVWWYEPPSQQGWRIGMGF